MRFSSFRYLLREGFRGLWVNRLMTIASVGTLFACLLLIGVMVLFSLNINNLIGYMENQNEVVVFLKSEVGEEDIESVESRLKTIDNVSDVVFISKEEGLLQQMEIFGDDKEYFQALLEEGENPIPDSFRVKLTDVDGLDGVVQIIENMEEVEEVSAPTQAASIITAIKRTSYTIGIALTVILLAVSFLIISNTIRVTVFNRRKEINIMKYVGASDTFIQFPFIVEGIIIGLIAGIMAFLVISLGYDYVVEWMRGDTSSLIGILSSETVDFSKISIKMLIGFCVGSAGIGMIGSALFVRKYLKV